jgi:hypothetical protein
MPLKEKIGSLSLVLMLAVVALGAGEAGAARKHAKAVKPVKPVGSEITLTGVTADGATGFISSAQGVCVSDRVVNLYRENSTTTVPSSVVVATVRTRPDGTWSVNASTDGWMYPGQYWADVQPNRVKRFNPTKRFDCQYAASNEKYF